MPWHVRVDPKLCMASGMCAAIAPDVFVLDGKHSRVLSDGMAPDERVLDAVDCCPAQAITVHDGDALIAPEPA